MKVYETIDTVLNHKTGNVTTMKKIKPVGPTRGHVKIELYDEHGDLETSADVNNIAVDWMDQYAYNSMYNYMLTYNYGTYTDSSNFPTTRSYSMPLPLRYIHLTDWDKAEHKDTPFICGSSVGYSMVGYLYSGSSTSLGTFNSAESRRYINSDGQYVMSFVFDWPTHAANGTFQSLWLSNAGTDSSLGADTATTRNFNEAIGWPSDVLNIISSTSSDYARPNSYNYSIIGTTVHVFKYSSASAPGSSLSSSPVIYQFDGNTLKYISHIQCTSDMNSASRRAKPIPKGDGGYYLVDCFNSSYSAKIWDIDSQGNMLENYTLNLSSLTGITDDNDNVLSATLGITPSSGSSSYADYLIQMRAETKSLLITARSKVDSKYYNYLVEYDLTTKTHKKTFLNDVVNPYIPAANRNTAPITFTNGTYMHPDYGTLYYWVGSDRYIAGTFTMTNIEKMRYVCSYRPFRSDTGQSDKSLSCTSTYIKLSPRTAPPTTHTLLPAPITKTSTHTMKITYEVLVDLLPWETNSNFIDHLNAR